MKAITVVKLVLVVVVAIGFGIAIGGMFHAAPVHAQADPGYPFYVEPGYTMLRKPDGTAQMYGKMVIDMRTGDIWGFPTLTQSPYPIDPAQTNPPKSSPMYLGRFLFNQAVRPGAGGGY